MQWDIPVSSFVYDVVDPSGACCVQWLRLTASFHVQSRKSWLSRNEHTVNMIKAVLQVFKVPDTQLFVSCDDMYVVARSHT